MPKNNLIPVNLRARAHPVLYEVNARVLLRELSASSGKSVTLGTIPAPMLEQWKGYGIDAVWMMGVWASGPAGIAIARQDPGLLSGYRNVLPDLADGDVGGSPYAVYAYEIPEALGGEKGLSVLRARLADLGIGLILDFVPNHTACDNPWVHDHPDYYVQGGANDAEERPDLFFRAQTVGGPLTIAMGRDPSFAGWTDTAQINVFHPGARRAVVQLMKRIASMCDGIRCDMAMLVLGSVFRRTWGPRLDPGEEEGPEGEFWKEAITAVRSVYPDHLFIAEAYWNLEWDLQQIGFDYTYDKTLYDRLLREGAGSVRDHLRAEMEYQRHSLRFIENHDEPRAASSLTSESWLFAATAVIASVPGMVMFHEGQFEGRRVKLPVQLTRRPAEEPHPRTKAFYAKLLNVIASPAFRAGTWRMLMPREAWSENYSWGNFLIFWWHHPLAGTRLVVINYAPLSGQCYVDLPLDDVPGGSIEFRDLLGRSAYTRDRNGLSSKGIYFDIQPYGIHIFDVSSAT